MYIWKQGEGIYHYAKFLLLPVYKIYSCTPFVNTVCILFSNSCFLLFFN